MNENQHNPDAQNKPSDRESFTHQPHHDSHIIALVAMVIIVLGVVWVALVDEGGQRVGEPLDERATSSQEAGEASEGATNGPAVPQQEVSVSETSGLNDLPADLFVSEDGLLRNETTEFSERILVFTSSRSFGDLADTYQNFLEQNSYEIIQDKTAERAQKFAARGPAGEQVTIVVSQTDSASMRRVKLNYLAAN